MRLPARFSHTSLPHAWFHCKQTDAVELCPVTLVLLNLGISHKSSICAQAQNWRFISPDKTFIGTICATETQDENVHFRNYSVLRKPFPGNLKSPIIKYWLFKVLPSGCFCSLFHQPGISGTDFLCYHQGSKGFTAVS